MDQRELNFSLKFALFLLGLISVPLLLVAGLLLFTSIFYTISIFSEIDFSTNPLSTVVTYYLLPLAGIILYVGGRSLNLLGILITDTYLQHLQRHRLQLMFNGLGRELCFILIFIGSFSVLFGLIGNLMRNAGPLFYLIPCGWGIIVILAYLASHFLKQHAISKTEILEE